MSTRIERLKEYANPESRKNWRGAGRDQVNIDRWSERASANSKIAPRGNGGEVKLPSTGKRTELRDTEMKPLARRSIDALMAGKQDQNFSGSSFLPHIRRITG